MRIKRLRLRCHLLTSFCESDQSFSIELGRFQTIGLQSGTDVVNRSRWIGNIESAMRLHRSFGAITTMVAQDRDGEFWPRDQKRERRRCIRAVVTRLSRSALRGDSETDGHDDAYWLHLSERRLAMGYRHLVAICQTLAEINLAISGDAGAMESKDIPKQIAQAMRNNTTDRN